MRYAAHYPVFQSAASVRIHHNQLEITGYGIIIDGRSGVFTADYLDAYLIHSSAFDCRRKLLQVVFDAHNKAGVVGIFGINDVNELHFGVSCVEQGLEIIQ